jgi:signal transduction histidine kinase
MSNGEPMDLNIAALIATAIASISLGLIALLRGRDRPINRLFGVHAAVVAAWVGLTVGVMSTLDPSVVATFLKGVHFVSAFVLSTFVDFVWAFPDQLRLGPARRRWVLHGLAAVFGGVCLLPALVRSVTYGPFGPNVEFGWPLAVFALWGFGTAMHANLVLLHKARTRRGVSRVQTIYVLIGTLTSEIIILTTNVVLPMITGQTSYSRWGAAGYLLTVAAIAIAISKYHLWQLGGVTRRALAATLAVGTVLPVTGTLLWYITQRDLFRATAAQYYVLWSSAGAVIGLLLAPVYRAFLGLVAGPRDRHSDRIGQLLGALGAAITQARPAAEVLTPILAETRRFFGCDFVEVFLRNSSGVYRCAAVEEQDDPASRPRVLNRRLSRFITNTINADGLDHPLDAAQLARFGAVDDASVLLGVMEELDASVIVPIRWEEATIGLLVVGPRMSRDMYYLSDVDLLETVADHVAIAVKDAELRAAILSEKERTEKVLGQIQSGVIAVDASRAIRLANPAACALLQCQQSDLVGHGVSTLPRVIRAPLLQALEAGVAVTGQSVILSGEGLAPGTPGRVRLSCSTFMLRGPGGRTEGAGIVLSDMSTEDALREAEQETERLRFIRALSAGLAHEIRNPLVAIRTFAELAPLRLDDPEFRDSFLKVAQSEIHRLEDLVSQFMTLARPPRPAADPVILRELAASVTTTVSAQAQQSRVTVANLVPADLPPYRADEGRLYQALLNLAQNAVDATPSGGRVELRAHYQPLDAQRGGAAPSVPGTTALYPGEMTIVVWNSGSFIPPEERQRVFEPFYTNKPRGTGLGLAISQTIAHEHGGKLSVESDEEAGTAFSLRLPVLGPSALPGTLEQAETAVAS